MHSGPVFALYPTSFRKFCRDQRSSIRSIGVSEIPTRALGGKKILTPASNVAPCNRHRNDKGSGCFGLAALPEPKLYGKNSDPEQDYIMDKSISAFVHCIAVLRLSIPALNVYSDQLKPVASSDTLQSRDITGLS